MFINWELKCHSQTIELLNARKKQQLQDFRKGIACNHLPSRDSCINLLSQLAYRLIKWKRVRSDWALEAKIAFETTALKITPGEVSTADTLAERLISVRRPAAWSKRRGSRYTGGIISVRGPAGWSSEQRGFDSRCLAFLLISVRGTAVLTGEPVTKTDLWGCLCPFSCRTHAIHMLTVQSKTAMGSVIRLLLLYCSQSLFSGTNITTLCEHTRSEKYRCEGVKYQSCFQIPLILSLKALFLCSVVCQSGIRV
jgi:hypothetical protein